MGDGRILLRLDPAVADRALEVAEARGESRNTWIANAVSMRLDAEDTPLPDHLVAAVVLNGRCCPGEGSMAHVRGCINHPEHQT